MNVATLEVRVLGQRALSELRLIRAELGQEVARAIETQVFETLRKAQRPGGLHGGRVT